MEKLKELRNILVLYEIFIKYLYEADYYISFFFVR